MAISRSKALRDGIRAALPFLIVVAPFGALFGVVATEAGLDISQTMGFTVLVIAGASQFTALQLMNEQAPALIVLASALAVNLRMSMYSASLAAHIGKASFWQRALCGYLVVDQTYALAMQRYEDQPQESWQQKLFFFFGTALPIFPVWIGATWAGAELGTQIPPEYALDFALPITFLALIAPALRTIAHVAAAITAVILALSLAWIPHNLWILLSGLGGMLVGAEIERRMGMKS